MQMKKHSKVVMALFSVIAMLFAAVPMVATPVVAGTEDLLLGIGSFEDETMTGWQVGAAGEVSVDHAVYHSGTASLKLDRTAMATDDTTSVHITQSKENDCAYYLPVMPNTQYTVSLWYKVNVGAQLYFDFDGYADAAAAMADERSGYVYGVAAQNVDGDRDWTQLTFSFLTSENVNLLKISVANNGYSGIAWVDDVTMSEHQHTDSNSDNYCDMTMAIFGGDRNTTCGAVIDSSVVSHEIVIGDFEGTHGWIAEGTGSSVSSNNTMRGTGALELARSSGACYARKLVSLEPNTVYVLSYWYNTTADTTLQAYAYGYDSACTTNLGGKSLKVTYNNTWGIWTQASVVFKTDSDAMTNVQFQFINQTDGETAYVDQVTISKHTHNDENGNGFCDATEIHCIAGKTVESCPEKFNQELIGDPSFENASLIGNWGGKGSVTASYARTGNQSLLLPAPVDGSTQLATYTAYNIVAGETYRLSYWVYNPGTVGNVRLSYTQFSISGGSWVSKGSLYDLYMVGNTGNDWKLVSIDILAKEDVSIFQFSVNVSTAGKVAAYIDDMSLVHIGNMSMVDETVEGNLHYNPSSDAGTSTSFTTFGNAYLSAGVAQLAVTQGVKTYIQTPSITVEADAIYTLTFWAKAIDVDKASFNVYMTGSGGTLRGWIDYALGQDQTITGDTDGWVKKTISFTTRKAGWIAIGYRNYDTTGTTGTIYLDNFSLVRSHVPANHGGDYLMPSSLSDSNLLAAGSFDSITYWNIGNNSGIGVDEVVDGVAVIRPGYKEGVANPDYLQSNHTASALTAGKWYQISFWTYIVPDSNLKVDLFLSGGGAGGWKQKTIPCETGKWVRVCRYFEAKADEKVYIGFRDTSTGAAVSGAFYIDDVAICELNSIKFTGTQATLSEQIHLNYHFQMPKALVESGYFANANIRLTVAGKTQTVSFASATAVSSDDTTNTYYVPVTVPAAQMAESITAELELNGGDRSTVMYDGAATYSAPTFSVKQNADEVIASGTAAEAAAAKAMLNYGTMAQYYFLSDDGGDFANPPLFANSSLVDADRFDKSETEAFQSLVGDLSGFAANYSGSNSDFVGYTLIHKDTTSVRFFVKSADTKVTIDGVVQTLKAHKNGYYYAEIANIKAVDLDATHTLVIGNTLTVSNVGVCSVAKTVIEDNTKSVNFRNMMIALILYAQAVDQL